jgi:hypothetical protein
MSSQPSKTIEPLQLRHFNTERLQNAFEDIIGKYARDFTEVGDEIDLDTNQITSNKGHLQQMRNEQDTGRYIDNFVNDIHRGGDRRPTIHQEEDEEWEDVDDMDLDQLDHQSPSLSPPQQRYVNQQAPPSRQINHILPNPPSRQSTRPLFSPVPQTHPSNQFSSIAANRDMIHDFAQGIAGQITEFLYFFAGTIQNQPPTTSTFTGRTSMPPPPTPRQEHYDPSPTIYSRSSHKRRRTADENPPPPRKSAVNRLAALRAEGIQTPPSKTKHGHRGVTPGMPSLWSGEEDSDYAPRRPSVKRPLTTPTNAPVSRPSTESHLRAEVRNLSEPLAFVDEQVQPGNRAATSPAVNLLASTKSSNRVNPEDELDEDTFQDYNDPPQHYEIPDSEDEMDSPETTDVRTRENMELLRMSKQQAKKYHPRIAFTPEHDRLIMKLKLEGKTYPDIAARLPHSSNQVMYRWKQFLEKGNMSAGFGRKTQEERKRLALMSVIRFSRETAEPLRGISEEYDPSEDEAGLNVNPEPFEDIIALTPEPSRSNKENDDSNIDPALRSNPNPAIKDEEDVDDLNIDPALLSKPFKLTPKKKSRSGKNTPTRREKANTSRAMVNTGEPEDSQNSLLSLLEATPTAQWSTGKKTGKTSRSAKNTPSRATARVDLSPDTTTSEFVSDLNFNIITGPLSEKKKKANKRGKATFKVRPQHARADTELEEPDSTRRDSWVMEDFSNDQG